MGSPTKYDILGNIITFPITTTTVNYTTVTTRPPTTPSPTTSTTTPVPAIEQDPELTHLDVFVRYPSLSDLLQRFAPESIEIDKFVTPCWLPISCLSLVICSVVFANWQRVRGGRKGGEAICLTGIRGKNASKPGRPSFMASGQFLCYCILYLFYCVLVALHDLDGVWNTSVLTWIRAACPITHGLKMTFQISIALTTLLIGLRGLLTTRLATGMPPRRPLCCRRIRDLRKCVFGRLQSAVLIAIVSIAAGMLNVLFWEVALDTMTVDPLEQASPAAGLRPSPLRLRCRVVGGYPNIFRLQFMANPPDEATGRGRDVGLTYAIYLWSLNLTIFLPISLASLAMAFLLRRRWLKRAEAGLQGQMADPIYCEAEKRHPLRLDGPAVEENDQLKLSCAVCVLHGLFSLPIALLFMLLPVSVPGVNELPDKEILEDPSWQRFFQYAIAVSAARELHDLASALLLLVCVAASAGFRRRCASLLALRSSTDRSLLSEQFSKVDRRRRRLQYRALSWLRRCLPDLRRLPSCVRTRSRRSLLTPRSLFSPADQPTWRWGAGWRFPGAATVASPPPPPPPLHQPWSPLASPTASDGTVLSPRQDVDPDLLDALVQQHNAYAAEAVMTEEEEPLSDAGQTPASPLSLRSATALRSPQLVPPTMTKQSSGRRYIKNQRTDFLGRRRLQDT